MNLKISVNTYINPLLSSSPVSASVGALKNPSPKNFETASENLFKKNSSLFIYEEHILH